jgi:hypothetical protein
MANDHDLLQLFDTPTPSINMQKVVPVNLLLISELKFHEFSHDRRVVDNIRNGPSSLIDLLSLYRDHEVYSPACPSEIRFIGATGIEDPEQKYLLLLRICTGDSFLDAPYNIMNSAISYYMVVQRSADQHYHFLPLMPSSVELSCTDHERVNNIGNGILPSPISDAMLGKIQAMTGRRKLVSTLLTNST